jgi:hypothetical protein
MRAASHSRIRAAAPSTSPRRLPGYMRDTWQLVGFDPDRYDEGPPEE